VSIKTQFTGILAPQPAVLGLERRLDMEIEEIKALDDRDLTVV
jgi:hypothetical protein